MLFNKFIDHILPLMHVYRSIFNMSYKLICMLFWISVYVLIESHKFLGKFFDFSWAAGSYIGEDADLVCFFTLFKPSKGIVPRHSTWKLHCGSSRKPAFLSSSSSLKINSSPGYLFIALFWFRSIILKVISTYIYPLEAHSLYLSFFLHIKFNFNRSS